MNQLCYFSACHLVYTSCSPVLRLYNFAIPQVGHDQGDSPNSLRQISEDTSGPPSPVPLTPSQKQLRYSPGIANGMVRDSVSFIDHSRKVPIHFPFLVISWISDFPSG